MNSSNGSIYSNDFDGELCCVLYMFVHHSDSRQAAHSAAMEVEDADTYVQSLLAHLLEAATCVCMVVCPSTLAGSCHLLSLWQALPRLWTCLRTHAMLGPHLEAVHAGGGVRGSASQAALDGLGASGLGSQSHLLSWADRTFGQGLTTITKGG